LSNDHWSNALIDAGSASRDEYGKRGAELCTPTQTYTPIQAVYRALAVSAACWKPRVQSQVHEETSPDLHTHNTIPGVKAGAAKP